MARTTRLGMLVTLALALGSRPALAQAPAGVTPAAVAKGDSLFHSAGNCYACHGGNAQGAVGPNLTDTEWIHSDGSYDAIVKQITTGVPQSESKSGIVMPPKGGSSIRDEDVKAIAAYVWSLSHKKAS